MTILIQILAFVLACQCSKVVPIDDVEVSLLDSVTCRTLNDVRLQGDAFAHGHSKAAFFGKLSSVDVVVKRPYGD